MRRKVRPLVPEGASRTGIGGPELPWGWVAPVHGTAFPRNDSRGSLKVAGTLCEDRWTLLALFFLTLWRNPPQQLRGSGALVLRTWNLSQQVASKVNGDKCRAQDTPSLHGCSASRLSVICLRRRVGHFRSKLQAWHAACQLPF